MYAFSCLDESAEGRVKTLLHQIYSELQASSEEKPVMPSFESVMEKVVVVEGDISQVSLGLNNHLYQQMAAKVAVTIHAAAQVNSVLPYTGM